jgi:three-Cys-motif partner protein
MSKKGDNHFNQKDIQTHLKHILLEDYLKNWSQVFANANHGKSIRTINFVDGFAGRGYFDDGHWGSPQIAMNRLLYFQNILQQEYGNNLRFNIYNVEYNSEYYDELEKIKLRSSHPHQIKNFAGKFEEHLESIISFTQGKPTLYFIDPFGYKGVNMRDMHRILQQQSNELLINVMSYSLVRNLPIKSSEKELCNFFGVSTLPPDISEYLRLKNLNIDTPSNITMQDLLKLEDDIIELYKNQVKSCGSNVYTLSKRIHSQINNNIYFHLVFVTRNRKGLIEMKKSMVQFEELRIKAEDKYVAQHRIDTIHLQDDLFSDFNRHESYEYQNFVSDFFTHFNKKPNVTYAKIIDFYLQNSPLPFDSVKDDKSITHFTKTLFTTNKNLIKTTNKAFKDHKDLAENNIITSSLPPSFLANIVKPPETYEQIHLF